MEEESERLRESRLEAWGRDDFSVHKVSRVLGEQTVESTQEVTCYMSPHIATQNVVYLILRLSSPCYPSTQIVFLPLKM